ncbi:hypothetical protein F383_36416 [Gossypium arboreum]|uniref:Uncharacterized protein n=1 Tax=Gossypium arboreum TaxID=29729 RepID=A0A0B0MKD1_GOSAR|nr:hypothetical protein F383_37929 [Gossypium arboreum]KHF99918.1 hypothetical protein F383_38749 [Gossypium arboreum]KHG30443.1 hypothetical protein F383_36416 [Gossypium arboreum]
MTVPCSTLSGDP